MSAENQMEPSRGYRHLLGKVSRSFSLSLFALPRKQRSFVGHCYLAARVADSFADSGNYAASQRLEFLEAWETALLARNPEPWSFEDSVGSLSAEEAQLLLCSEDVLAWYRDSPESLRHHGDELLGVLIEGMKKLVKQTAEASKEKPEFCHASKAEFDQYCYYHAGCVGLFWNRVFDLPVSLEPFAVDYGKALERVNILRDVIEDHEQGRVLLAVEDLERLQFESSEPWREAKWRDFTKQYFQETKPLVIHALQYVDSIPTGERRLRFASMVPIKILIESFDLYRKEMFKKEQTKIKRSQVRRLLRESLLDVALGRKISSRYSRRLSRM